MAVAAKFKWYLTGGTASIGAFCKINESLNEGVTDILGSEYLYFLTGSCATLFAICELFRRSLGIVYLSEDGATVRIGRITIFGRRHDFNVPLRDIVPLTDYKNELRKGETWKLIFYKDSEAYKKEVKILTAYGGAEDVINVEKFRLIFGDVEVK